jgi:hypothetical protein
MRTAVASIIVVTVSLGLLSCGGAQAVTEKRMLEWGPLLNMVMATNFEQANAYPDSLDAIEPGLRADLKTTDGWGNGIVYRKLRIDKYNLISAGPDGTYGNDDDIVVENGALYPAAEIYAKSPFKR